MKYQKIANLLDDNLSEGYSKFKTKNWVEINDELRGIYNHNSQIRLKTSMLKSSLRDYSDAFILVKGTITIAGEGTDAAAKQRDERDKGAAFKNCAPFITCISEINNVQIDNAHDIDIVAPVYNLIEYSLNYVQKNTTLYSYYRDDPNNDISESASFKSEIKLTGKTPNNSNRKDVEIICPLKYLSSFWRTLINLINQLCL